MASGFDPHIQASFEKLIVGASETEQFLGSPTAPLPLKGFNDQKLREISGNLFFPIGIKNRYEMKKALIRFFEFYFLGTMRKGDNLNAIINDAIALTRTRNQDLWSDHHFGKTPFYSANISDDLVFGDVQKGEMSILAPSSTYTSGQARSEYNLLSTNYTHVHKTQFMEKVKQILNAIDPARAATAEEEQLRQVAGFLAITLYQFATKNVEQMKKTFKQKQYVQKLAELTGWPVSSYFCPPSAACFELCEIKLQKGGTNTYNMFAILLNEFVAANGKDYNNDYVD